MVENLPVNSGDMGSIPGLGTSLGEGNGNRLQYSGLENPMDCSPWVAKSQTRLSDFTFTPTLQEDSLPAEPQGKPKNTGVGILSLPQWVFPTQELNQGLLHCRRFLYQLSY